MPPRPALSPTVPSSRRNLFTLPDGRRVGGTFALVSSLFLLWGFCNGMIDVMDKHFQDELHLTLAQSAWVQFAHYLGYFLMALPAGWVATRFGYKGGIIAGLLLVAAGGFWFIPATQIAEFWAFLLGVCVIAAGLTFLETVANPYTTVLGDKSLAATRINLAQSCNGIGWMLGPLAGRMFFYSTDASGQSTGAETLWIPYAAVGVVVLVLAGLFFLAPMPDVIAEESTRDGEEAPTGSVWRQAHFSGAVIAQFFYVAAQTGIFSFFINYMTSQSPALPGDSDSWLARHLTTVGADGLRHISDAGAASLASAAFFFFLVGRFSGTALLRRYSAARLLALYGVVNVALCIVVMCRLGWISVAAVFLTYLFMSIMFPTIFALGVHGLGVRAKRGAAYIVMAIMGGAIVPKVMGAVGDARGMSSAFVIPLLCFAVVATYGMAWKRLVKHAS